MKDNDYDYLTIEQKRMACYLLLKYLGEQKAKQSKLKKFLNDYDWLVFISLGMIVLIASILFLKWCFTF